MAWALLIAVAGCSGAAHLAPAADEAHDHRHHAHVKTTDVIARGFGR